MMKKSMIVLSVAMSLVFSSSVGAGIPIMEYYEKQQGEPSLDSQDGGQGEKQYNETPQLSSQDIIEMNDGDCAILLDEDGYITFLRGKYYDKKVENIEDAITSLNGIAQALGISRGSEFYGVFGEVSPSGYTHYVMTQRYGDLTIENAVIKVIVDPDGYTAGVMSSFTPNVGILPPEETSLTAEDAENLVRQRFAKYNLEILPEYTRQTSVTIDRVARHVWAVFTPFPENLSNPEGRAYLEHLVSYEGQYMMYQAVVSPEEMVLGDNLQTEVALSWFDGMEPDTYTGEVTLHDGTRKTVTVPVMRNPRDGLWYLGDVQRKILLADCYAHETEHRIQPWTSEDNTGWPEHYLITYDSYIKVFDFFNSLGINSVDGFGAPILILTDYCDRNHVPEDNASFMGMKDGWALIAASEVNDYGECVDVCGHEFTHGMTNYSLCGDIYENESGSINEGLSDVFGNICEIMLGETADTEWLMGENCGEPVRSLSDPASFRLPTKVGDRYYMMPQANPAWTNDFGGVHQNCTLIGHVAWLLNEEGLDMRENLLLWREAVNLLTPKSGYRELHQALIFAARIRGLSPEWEEIINRICKEAGY